MTQKTDVWMESLLFSLKKSVNCGAWRHKI